jgi:hypothetical protein
MNWPAGAGRVPNLNSKLMKLLIELVLIAGALLLGLVNLQLDRVDKGLDADQSF